MTVVPMVLTTGTTTTTTTTGGGCTPSITEEFTSIVTQFEKGVTVPSQFIYEALFDYYTEQPSAYLIYAIRETACAPRPSFMYFKAIMNRLIREHPDPDQLIRPRVREQRYQQREYSDSYSMTPRMLEKLRELQSK